MRLLAGDIGGTNARLVLYEAPQDASSLRDGKTISSHKVLAQMYYKNNDFQSFTDVLCSFISLPAVRQKKINSCCLAVAGPVSDNHINFTNREGWIIDGNSIKDEFGIDSVVLMNDFVANGYGLLSLSHQDLAPLQDGETTEHGEGTDPVALVGAGTGLGECYLTPTKEGDLVAFPTEGGHVEFAPRTELEFELLRYMQNRLDTNSNLKITETDVLPRVSVERIVSGKGLENIYEFLREKYPDQVDEAYDTDYNESNERGRLIGSEKYNYKLFRRALEIMFGVFGDEVGNCILKYLPYGGLYIAGGIAPKNIEFIRGQDSEFMRRFMDKGRMSSIMSGFPVYVVMKEDLGLRGAHTVASRCASDILLAMEKGKEEVDDKKRVKLSADALPTSRESKLSIAESVREAVTAYPLTYAVVTTLTSAVTAGVLMTGMQVVKKWKVT